MPQKIKILAIRKTDEYIQNELSILRARKNKLLISSDWTQLIDNGLSIKNVMQWRFWRNKVRQLDILDSSNIITVNRELDALDSIRPIALKRTSEHFVFIMNDFNYSSVDNFKKSCILILEECFGTKKHKEIARIKKATSIDKAFDYLISAL